MTRPLGQAGAALAASVAIGVVAFIAFRIVGWLGVGIVGLATALVAVQVDMDSAAPIGTAQNTGQFAGTIAAQEAGSRADRAARRAETVSRGRILLVAKVLGGVLALIGAIGFFLVQLPG